MFKENETLSIGQIWAIFKRSIMLALTCMLLGTLLAFLATEYLPKKFKSKAVLSIQSSYFQHPLVSDVVSELQDPSEMSARRLSLLRLALNDQFLDKLGEAYQIYKHPSDSRARVMERELFLKQIEYFSISPSSFQVSLVAKNPQTALYAAQDVLAQMTFTLIQQRYSQLVQAQQAILKQAKILKGALDDTSALPQRETLQRELDKMQSNLSALQSRFTEGHPEVLKMKGATQALRTRIKNLEIKSTTNEELYSDVFLSPSSRTTTQDIFNDLLKKLSHLNIVLEMERDRANVSYLGIIEKPSLPMKAFSPDPIVFAAMGAAAGLALALIIIISRELKRASLLTPRQAESYFGLELIGELPPLTSKEKKLLIEGPTRELLVALPVPSREN